MKKSIGAKTILYPSPVLIVATYDKKGKPNAMTAAWGGICCSEPPCVTVSLRKATYSYSNIVENKAYTINIPSENYVKECDYFGMASGKKSDKFLATGLTPIKSDLVAAPYIKEFPLILECKLLHTFEIGLHTQFVGEIVDVKVDERVMDKNGNPDIEKVKPIIYATSSKSYYGIGEKIGDAWSIGKDIRDIDKQIK
jgi:flavin reductase (DIM6/NTAB) family NADH-FMN oxidoreductase RutF